MNFDALIPISFFIAVVMAIKVVVDSRLRRRLAETNPSEELMKQMMAADEVARRLSALKWGLVLTLLGVAFGIIEATGLNSDNPGAWGILLAAAGIGMLAYHALANKFRN
ncbi:MAG: hypothetical protein ABI588_02585 [Arenimonas sp.]